MTWSPEKAKREQRDTEKCAVAGSMDTCTSENKDKGREGGSENS